MAETFYITTAIDYVNGQPHLGTAYEKIAADVLARYNRLIGRDVRFLMGNDEHSLKVEQAARERGLEPLEWCDRMEATFRAAWACLDVEFDDFIRTTQERHRVAVQGIVAAIKENGDIYTDTYEGWYCNGCEAFKTETELDDGKCPAHIGTDPVWLEEKNYFFRLSRYNDFLLELYESNPDFIQPEVRRNELLELLRSGLRDISISRESAGWGVKIPFDESAVVYVWFDALVNYIAGIGWPNDLEQFEKYWPADVHMIGKDITRFHAVIWPAMLKSAGLPLPKVIFGHGFVNSGSDRLSKSSGNRIAPEKLVERYSADAIRYFLMAETTFGRDVEYTEERLVTRTNSDLANGLGNLASRTLSMIVKYRDGVLPDPSSADALLESTAADSLKAYQSAMENLRLRGGIDAAMSLVARANLLVDEQAPWALAKDPERAQQLDRVLYDLAEAVRVAAVLLSPFMPRTMNALLSRLGHDADTLPQIADATWGCLEVGMTLEKAPPLFPRFDQPEAE